jgi:hypothetical protein
MVQLYRQDDTTGTWTLGILEKDAPSSTVGAESRGAEAYLWCRERTGGDWRRVQIPLEGVALGRSSDRDLPPGGDARERVSALIIPFKERGAPRAVLLTSPSSGRSVLRSGYPALGVALLEEREEINVDSHVFYFSALAPIEHVPFPEKDAATRCSRCKAVLQPGDEAVRCPCRAAWFHEGAVAGSPDAPRKCFSYEAACVCGRTWEELDWKPRQEEQDND